MPPFDDVNANPERKERFDGALVNCGARRAAIATRPRKKPHKPPLHTHNWRIGRASEATPLNGPGVTLRRAPASGISALIVAEWLKAAVYQRAVRRTAQSRLIR